MPKLDLRDLVPDIRHPLVTHAEELIDQPEGHETRTITGYFFPDHAENEKTVFSGYMRRNPKTGNFLGMVSDSFGVAFIYGYLRKDLMHLMKVYVHHFTQWEVAGRAYWHYQMFAMGDEGWKGCYQLESDFPGSSSGDAHCIISPVVLKDVEVATIADPRHFG